MCQSSYNINDMFIHLLIPVTTELLLLAPLCRRENRLRDDRQFAQGHTASEDWNPGSLPLPIYSLNHHAQLGTRIPNGILPKYQWNSCIYLDLPSKSRMRGKKSVFPLPTIPLTLLHWHYSANSFHLAIMVRTLCLTITDCFPASTNPTRKRPQNANVVKEVTCNWY